MSIRFSFISLAIMTAYYEDGYQVKSRMISQRCLRD